MTLLLSVEAFKSAPVTAHCFEDFDTLFFSKLVLMPVCSIDSELRRFGRSCLGSASQVVLFFFLAFHSSIAVFNSSNLHLVIAGYLAFWAVMFEPAVSSGATFLVDVSCKEETW